MKKVRRRQESILLSVFLINGCVSRHNEVKMSEKIDTWVSTPEDYGVDVPLAEERLDDDPREGLRLEKVVKADVVRMLVDHGFPKESVPKMVCTARFESNFSAFASNLNRNGTIDTGLFQINDIWLKTCNVTREDLLDPEENTRCAYTVFKKQGLKAWMAYNRKKSACQKYKLEPSLMTMLQDVPPKPKPKRS